MVHISYGCIKSPLSIRRSELNNAVLSALHKPYSFRGQDIIS